MPTITLKAPFQFSPDGVEIIDYPPGTHDVSDRCAEVAAQAGAVAEAENAPAKRAAPALSPAPETAATQAAPEVK